MADKGKIVKRNKARGRAFQAKQEKLCGGKNVGTLGGEDVSHPIFSFECKSLKKFAGRKVMEQAEKNCPKGKIAVSIVHVVGERHFKDLHIIRREVWDKLIKKIKKEDLA